MPRIHGWLHEVTATDWGVNTYWITGKGVICAFYPFTAEFYLAKNDRRTKKQILSHPQVESVEEVSKYISIHAKQPQTVFRVRVNPLRIRSTYEALRNYWGEYLHNTDLSIWQQFCFQTGLFPYAYATIETKNGRLQNNWKLLEPYTAMDYQAVPFRGLWIHPTFEDQHSSKGKLQAISIRHSVIDQEEEAIVFENRVEGETIRDCIQYLHKLDPDILFTSGGDTFLPIIAQRAVQAGEGNLRLGRGSRTLSSYVKRLSVNRGHSYMSYGRVFYSQHGVYLDGGRHHYDVGNSFMWKDGNLEGVLEITRLSCTDPQRIARGTIGTALSAVQMRTAYNHDILIPARKADAEHFRPAWAMQSDVGGLVFSPIVGFHANVTELDFLSMYPNIMVRKNVSPETINCKCCVEEEQQVVPLTDHHICTQRPGLIGLSLENILHRREYFKARRNQHPSYDRRQKVLKWILVCCFELDTILPVYTEGRLKLVRIGNFIDDLIENKTILDGSAVIGVDGKFKTFFNPIKRAFRLKSPAKLYQIRLETGREFTVTGDHICYVLSNGRFQEKSANKIDEGDFLPVMLEMPIVNIQDDVEAISKLLETVSGKELDKWRVWGPDLSEYLQDKKSEIKQHMKGHHSVGAIRAWLNDSFIPLRYFPKLNIPRKNWKYLKIGYGRRVGGKIHWLPAKYTIDGDLGFFLGYFIGDGSARHSFLRLSVNSDDTDLVSWFEQFMIDRFDLVVHTRKESHTQMFTLQVNSTALVWILTEVFGVARTRAQGKLKVPPLILNGSKTAIFGFFGGLIASDGDVNSKRNVIKISSCDHAFVQELSYAAGRLGLYLTLQRNIPQKGTSMYAICFSGEKNLATFLKSGYIKRTDEIKIRSKSNKIRSRALAKDLPVEESKLLSLARKARTARNPRLSGKIRKSREAFRTQIRKIKERQEKLSYNDLKQLEVVENLVNGDLGFARVTNIAHIPSKSEFVYCFEVKDYYPGFVAGVGGIFSHNCFGYQGYRNARFGRIEAHEAISAYGRHALTLTQQLAATYGLEAVAGIVDSIWLKQQDGEPIDLATTQELRQRVEKMTKLPVEHAADYHWIVFLPRRHEPEVGVLNRYYGLRTDGSFKIRGIEIRQSSSPSFIKKLQQNMLKILAKTRTAEQFKTATLRAQQLLKNCQRKLKTGQIPLEELLITIRPSRLPQEYVHNSRQAITARQLARLGVPVEPGMKLQYLMTDVQAKDPTKRVKVRQLLTGKEQYDIEEYQKLCLRSYENLIPPEFEKKRLTLESFLLT